MALGAGTWTLLAVDGEVFDGMGGKEIPRAAGKELPRAAEKEVETSHVPGSIWAQSQRRRAARTGRSRYR
jgi:hypothetical protein